MGEGRGGERKREKEEKEMMNYSWTGEIINGKLRIEMIDAGTGSGCVSDRGGGAGSRGRPRQGPVAAAGPGGSGSGDGVGGNSIRPMTLMVRQCRMIRTRLIIYSAFYARPSCRT